MSFESTAAHFDDRAVAVVGMSGRFPKAPTLERLWSNLVSGVDAVDDLARRRPDVLAHFDPVRGRPGKSYSKWGALLDDPDEFDAAFFQISPREAQMMDPQQRLLLETAWEALENAGYADGSLPAETGVFVGAMASEYLPHLLADPNRIDPHTVTGNHTSVVSNRVSFFLNLHGPSLTVDVACSSSLAALHLAVQSLRAGECPFALVGATQAGLAAFHWVEFSRLGALSPTGRCRVFDADADGYVVGEGVGCLVLRPLADALAAGDQVLGVIRGVAVGHGGLVSGLTVPSPQSQARILRRALDDAGVSADRLTYVEAHGTGTPLGDPVEVEGLTLAFRQDTLRRQFCALGSIKSNIGHLESAAGMAGLLKVLLCFRHRTIPGNLHLRRPNPKIDFAATPFFLAERNRPWNSDGPRCAAVHASGFGGSIAFAVLEEPPAPHPVEPAPERPRHVLRLSARTETALRSAAARLALQLEEHSDDPPANVAYTANVGRRIFEHRLCLHGGSSQEILDALRGGASGSSSATLHRGAPRRRPVAAFLFSGQGVQRHAMGRGLYQTSLTFRSALEECAAQLCDEFGIDLLEGLFGAARDAVDETAFGQPSLFAFQYALTRLWERWGVRPDVVLGHSLGEFTAAWAAGSLDGADALRLVARRGALMQSLPDDGAMLAVLADRQVVSNRIAAFGGRLAIAAINTQRNTVVAGPRSDLEPFAAALEREGLASHPLNVRRAFHSPQVEPILDAFHAAAAGIPARPPRLRWITNVAGDFWPVDLPPDADHWRAHMASPVRFEDGIRAAVAGGVRLFVEIGPSTVLTDMARQIVLDMGSDAVCIPSFQPGREEWWSLCDAVCRLEAAGVSFDGRGFDRDYHRRRVSFPSYPFERKSFWIGPETPQPAEASTSEPTPQPTTDARPPIQRVAWRLADDVPPRSALEGVWIVFVDQGERAIPIVESLRSMGRLVAEIRRGDEFRREAPGRWTIRAADPSDFARLLDEAAALAPPAGVVYGWPMDPPPGTTADHLMEFVRLVQALTVFERQALQFSVVASDSVAAEEGEAPNPSIAALWGLVQTVTHEYPLWKTSGFDVPSAARLNVALARAIVSSAGGDVFALRGGGWRRRTLVTVDSAARKIETPRPGAVVVTGGLGAVGLAVAAELASRGYRSLVLASRGGLDRDENRRRAVRDLEKTGATVWTPVLDVADRESLERMLHEARTRFGGIVGVVHAAGLLADRLLRSLNASDLDLVLRPKSLAAHHLDELTQDDDLDFFVLCSSVVSLEGNVGQGSYAAANAYLDALADARRARGRVATSIHWGPWNAGMAARPELANAWARLGLTPIEASAAAVIAADLAVLPPANYAVVLRTKSGAPDVAPDPTPAGDANADAWPLDLLQRRLCDIFAEVLRLPAEDIDPAAPFRDFGLDSILAEEALVVVRRELGLPNLGVPVLFQHPTLKDLAAHLAPRATHGKDSPPSPSAADAAPGAEGEEASAAPGSAKGAAPAVQTTSQRSATRDIAVIGYACRFPGAGCAEEFWSNLVAERVATGPAPDDRWELLRRYYPYAAASTEARRLVGGWLTEIDQFDPFFFRMRPGEADHLDPRQRLFLEIAYQALEHAGYGGARLAGTRTGTFVGVGTQDYALLERIPPADLNDATAVGSAPSILASRLAYLLDLRGPCVPVDAACSSALVAVHLAMESLRRAECDYAVAGSVHLNLSAYVPTVLERMGVVSPTGVCRPFGEDADGLVPSEGVGALVLRRLEDAVASGDAIYAVLKGAAVNNDGRTNGIAAPNPDAQRAVLLDAWRDAGIAAGSLSYIEAHGTGTTVGDVVECQGIRDAFRGAGAQPACRIGSVKANIGHADIAAGIAGLLKVILALGRRILPATPNARRPNRRIPWQEGPLRLAQTTEAWTGPQPLRAGVSAFGFAGTNAHVVVEEAPPTPESVASGRPTLVVLSARTDGLLRRQARSLFVHLSDHADVSIEDVAFTLAEGRMHLPHRLAVLADSAAGLKTSLEQWIASASSERVLTACPLAPASLQRLAADYVAGESIDWNAVFSGRPARSIPLPPSELERMRCWVRRGDDSQYTTAPGPPPVPMHAPVWKPQPYSPTPTGSIRGKSFLILGARADASVISQALTRAGACAETVPPDPRQAAGKNAAEWIWIEPCRDVDDLDGALRDWIRMTRELRASPARRLTVVTAGGEAVSSPADVRSPTAAGVRAAARVFAREQADVSVSLLDVDALGAPEADLLVRAIDSIHHLNAGLALRAGGLYRMELLPVDGGNAEPLRRGGVCLVTGALGGLGAALVRWLASRYTSRILLLGRRPPSEARVLRRELQNLGAVSLYAQVDLSDRDEVRGAVELARAQFGRVEAVFHLAGAAEHIRYQELTETEVRRIVAPKVHGARNLDLATLDDPPERFVLFSSVAGLEGNVFQTAYSAASAWLDAFAAWRTAQGRPTLSLDWGPWLHSGMGAEFAARHPSSALDPSSALAAMLAAMTSGRTQTVLARRLPTLELPGPSSSVAISAPQSQSLLDRLAAILAEVLDVPASRLDPRTSFLDFGMDSRLAVEFARRLETLAGRRIPATIAFDHPNLQRLAEHLQAAEPRLAAAEPANVEPQISLASSASEPAGSRAPIAIVATAFRFPGASTPEAFWKNLVEGRDCIRDLSQSRFDVERYYDPEPGKPGKTVSRWGGLLDDIELFDAEFFQISDREAELLDPQQRLLLETTWTLLESAGRAGVSRGPNRTGVYIGASHSEYLQLLWPYLREHPEAMDIYVSTGNNLGLLANRLSFQLNLSGPSVTIDTACSSSLVAVCQAVEALRSGACDAAIAGGVNLLLTPEHFIAASRGGMLAADGRCKTFDQRADGYVRSEGVGLVLLRRLSDALADGDRILAVVRAAAVNHDGRTAGLTAPSGPAQTRLLLDAWRQGGVDPATIGYFEAHGTGTRLGDPIEVQALDEALRASGVRRQSVPVGAVKSSIGHLEAAAGIASLIKAVLCIQNRAIPPTLHVREPNAHVAFEQTRLFINDRVRPWTSCERLRAGVSAFGMGGANAHVVVESAPTATVTARSDGPSLFVLSARTGSALRRLAQEVAAKLALESKWNLGDVCFTAAVGRSHFARRIAVLSGSAEELSRRLGRFAEGDEAEVWTDANAPTGGNFWRELARRYLAGEEIDWSEAFRGREGRRVELPTYPFERRRFWIPVSFRNASGNDYYDVLWRPAALPISSKGAPAGQWLVLDDDQERGRGVADALLAAGGRAQSANFEGELPSDVTGVICIARPPDASGSEAQQAIRDVQAIVRLVQRFHGSAAGPREVCVAVESSQSQPGIDPRVEAIRAVLAAAAREIPRVRWRLAAYDFRFAADLAKTLAAELSAPGDGVGVGYFAGRRWIPTVVASKAPAGGIPLAQDLRILIVGGFGDLGFALASRLAVPGRKIALAGLRGLSGERLAKVQRLTATGSEVLALQGDVGEIRDVERWRREIEERFGRLDAIVHAAGDTRTAKLEAVSNEDVAAIFHTRARGAENLLRIAEGVRTIVFFSSASVLDPGPGQGVYAASHAFLDALARRAAGQGGPKIVSIGWGPWAGARAAESEEYRRFRQAEGVLPLTLDEATSAFEALVSAGKPHCAVLKLTAERRRGFLESGGQASPEPPDVPPISAPAPAAANDLRHVVRRVVAEILHIHEARVSPETPFRDLGLDSIMAMELCGRLKRELSLASLSPTVVFEHSSVEALAGFLASRGVAAPAPVVAAAAAEPASGDDWRRVAVVGVAARWPGAESLDEFWRMLMQGREAVGPIPPARLRLAQSIRRPPASMDERGGFLEDVDAFDPLFFQISGREAREMDPRQRLFLQTAYHALEDAGYAGDRLAGSRTGVYVAAGPSEYRRPGAERPDEFWATACSPATLASRIAYFLNLRGPCLPVDTACSSGLVAVHLAMQAIRAGEIDAALIGGVHLNLGLTNFEAFRQMGALAGDGRCRPFGDAASGFVPGEGVAALLLKPLRRAIADGDAIRAVLLGGAMNNDGRSNGLTAPNLLAQRDVLLAAWKDAGIAPSDVDFIECHGTGTPLGDPVELQAVDRAVRGRRTRRLLVGSVKCNIGHAEAAAGLAGLIKAILALQHQRIPPSLHAVPRNRHFDWERSVIDIPDQAEDWPGREGGRIAGVSAFGFSGTNVHVVVAEAPEAPQRSSRGVDAPLVLVISARTPEALNELRKSWAQWLLDAGRKESLSDIAATAALGRLHLRCRAAVWGASHEEWARGLTAPGAENRVVGVASGNPPPAEADRTPEALARSYVAGAAVDWRAVWPKGTTRQVSAPVYPFARERYWFPASAHEPESPKKDRAHARIEPAARDGRIAAALIAAESIVAQSQASQWEEFQRYLQAADAFALRAFARLVAAPPAFKQPGDHANFDQIAHRLRIAPFYLPWLRNCLDRLVAAGYLTQAGEEFSLVRSVEPRGGPTGLDAGSPGAPGLSELLQGFGSHLGEVLRGECDPLALLFPDGRMDLAHAAHAENIVVLSFARLAAAVIQAHLEGTPAGRLLRVLEVGGGAGGLTRRMLEGLPHDRIEYVLTDVSPELCRRAEASLADWPGLLECRPLDLERPAAEQGFAADRFDVIVATNVVHATRDVEGSLGRLAGLLAPGGALALTELVESRPWLELTFGLTKGWWAFEDRPLRSRGPLLPESAWRSALSRSGLTFAASAPSVSEKLASFGQRLFVAARAEHPAPIAARKETSAGRAEPEVDSLLFETAWTAAPMHAASDRRLTGHWLLFAPPDPLGQRLAANMAERGAQVSVCRPGTRFGRAGDAWTIHPDSAMDYERLLAEASAHEPLSGVVHAWSYGEWGQGRTLPETIFELDEGVAQGPRSLFLLAAALGRRASGQRRTRLVAATTAGSLAPPACSLRPDRASLAAILRSVAAEEPGLLCRCVDLEGTDAAEDAARIVDEMVGDDAVVECAYRGGVRLAPELRRLDFVRVGRRNLGLRTGGCYLITGGLGGIGLELARWLARRRQARLILVGARPLPTEDAAAGPLAGRLMDDATRAKLEAIAEIRQSSGGVLVRAGNAADLESMSGAFEEGIAKFGRIDGVFHLAGRLRDGRISRQGLGEFEAVWQPKVVGAWVLDRLTRLYPPDWLVLFSSVASPLGSAGQAAYAGANRHLDALAAVRTREGLPTLSISWGLWEEVGMARGVGGRSEVARALAPMPPELALEALPRSLELEVDNLTAARFRGGVEPAAMEARPADEPARPASVEEIARDVLRRLARLLEVPIDQIDPNEPLVHLGLDSIQAARLTRELEARHRRGLSVTVLRDNPSVSALSEYLHRTSPGGT
jgi:acyl transferase domain-containing protein/acyl carrier protein/SAM-dependent methyltransferase/dTDP-4-dehydrorhamnose reductase